MSTLHECQPPGNREAVISSLGKKEHHRKKEHHLQKSQLGADMLVARRVLQKHDIRYIHTIA